MLLAASLLLAPMVLTTSPNPTTPPTDHHVRAYVTGYNTVPGQTDAMPCTAASGANICGRHDAAACPRRIGLGTVVEIRGTTYVCEDRLAHKYDHRFDISCDKNTSCPPAVTGWATVHVYGHLAPVPEQRLASHAEDPHRRRGRRSHIAARSARLASSRHASRFVRHAANLRSPTGLASRG
jgi:hypothetical protein